MLSKSSLRIAAGALALGLALAGCGGGAADPGTPPADPAPSATAPAQGDPSTPPADPAPSAEAPAPSDPAPAAGETGFGPITSGTKDELLVASKDPAKDVDDASALRKKWEDEASEPLKASGDKYTFKNALFFESSSQIKPLLVTANWSTPEVQAGGKATVNFACLSTEPGVTMPVAIEVGDTFTGGTFTCGHNELAEGSFDVELPAAKRATVFTGRVPKEGYYLVGLVMKK